MKDRGQVIKVEVSQVNDGGRLLRSKVRKLQEPGRNRLTSSKQAFAEFVMSFALETATGLERRRGGKGGGWGLFATQKFYRGDYIAEYKGYRCTKEQATYQKKLNPEIERYQLWVHRHTKKDGYVVDASAPVFENTMARNANMLVNHPNTTMRHISPPLVCMHTPYLEALRDIEIGEEITWNYNDKRHGTEIMYFVKD